MATNEKMIKFITELTHSYLLELQNIGTSNDDGFTDLKEGDIVAFKTVDYLHHHYHHPFNTGIIKRTIPSEVDRLIRTVEITYIARPGERVVLNGELVLVTKGMQYTTKRPVGSIIKLCGKDEMEKSFELYN